MKFITFAAHMKHEQNRIRFLCNTSFEKRFVTKVWMPLFINADSFRKCVVPDFKRNTKRFKIACGTGHSGS